MSKEQVNRSGFCISYTVGQVPGMGRGVFADAPITKGALLWRHVAGQYLVYDEMSLRSFLGKLSRSEVIYELTHMFGLAEFPGYIIRILDDGVLINHSSQPTVAINGYAEMANPQHQADSLTLQQVTETLLSDKYALVAIRDLQAGDELTHDYDEGVVDPAFYRELCDQYGVSWQWK